MLFKCFSIKFFIVWFLYMFWCKLCRLLIELVCSKGDKWRFLGVFWDRYFLSCCWCCIKGRWVIFLLFNIRVLYIIRVVGKEDSRVWEGCFLFKCCCNVLKVFIVLLCMMSSLLFNIIWFDIVFSKLGKFWLILFFVFE